MIEKKETISVEMPKDQYDFLMELSEKLKTQDNRSTQDPLYLVYDVTDVIINDDYSPSLGGHDIKTRYVYKNNEDTDMGGIEESDVDEYCGDNGVNMDDLERLYVAEMPYVVNAHLTDEGAKLFIEQNKHNLNKPYTYANSFYRCWDMIDLRKFIIDFSTIPKQ